MSALSGVASVPGILPGWRRYLWGTISGLFLWPVGHTHRRPPTPRRARPSPGCPRDVMAGRPGQDKPPLPSPGGVQERDSWRVYDAGGYPHLFNDQLRPVGVKPRPLWDSRSCGAPLIPSTTDALWLVSGQPPLTIVVCLTCSWAAPCYISILCRTAPWNTKSKTCCSVELWIIKVIGERGL